MSSENKSKVWRETVTGALTRVFTDSATLQRVFRSSGGATRQDEEETSDAVVGDGKTHDVQQTGRSADFNVEAVFCQEANKAEKADVLRATQSAAVTVTGSDIDFVASSNKITSLTADKFQTLAGAEGLMLRIAGSGVAGNNSRRGRILSVTTGGGTEEIEIDADWLDLTDDTGGSVTLGIGEVLEEGQVEKHVNFLEALDPGDGGGGNSYWGYVGQRGNTWSHNMPGKGMMKDSFGYVGCDYLGASTDLSEAEYGGGTLTLDDDANTALGNEMLTGARHFSALVVDGSIELGAGVLLSHQHEVNGNCSKRPTPGAVENRRIDVGDFTMTTQFTIYHQHAPMANTQLKQRAGTKVTIAKFMTTPEGGEYVFIYHQVLLKGGGPQGKGKNDARDGQFSGTLKKGTIRGVMFTQQYFPPA